MTIDPPLQAVADALAKARPVERPTDLAVRRKEAAATMLLGGRPPQPGVTITERTVPVTGGEIQVRVYQPEALAGAPAPCFVFFHGGGWFQGDLDTAEVEGGPLAGIVPCVMVSVDYRLAPEHKFPTPLEDCYAAYAWVLDHTDELGVDPARIAIGGTSAGANLAAAVCLVARDRGVAMPILQLLDAPCVDLTMASASMEECAVGFGLTRADVDECVRFYVNDDAERAHPRVSPLHEPDLRGLAPAVVIVAEHDPVRDDGERWLAALHAAGVPGAAFRVLGHFHGTWIIPFTATCGLVADMRASALRRAFNGTLVPSFG